MYSFNGTIDPACVVEPAISTPNLRSPLSIYAASHSVANCVIVRPVAPCRRAPERFASSRWALASLAPAQLVASHLFLRLPPTSPLALLSYSVLARLSTPQGSHAVPPQLLRRGTSGGAVSSPAACGHTPSEA